jgi:hypothetical protein
MHASAAEVFENVPLPHGTQAICFVEGWKLPFTQSMHDVLPI